MKTTKTLAFNIANRVADMITQDADGQHTNESAIIRQIIFKHYEKDPRLSEPVEAQKA